jgi:RNA ligase (TIGR02306 family)
MSDLIVRVQRIQEIYPHPNADRLELAVVGGWQTATQKGRRKVGDLVVFLEPGCMVQRWIAETNGIDTYLTFPKKEPEIGDLGRVRAIKLRGEPSNGVMIDPPPYAAEGDDVAAMYGIQKYEPPRRKVNNGPGCPRARAINEHPDFPKYTDLKNLRHFPDEISEGEEVVMCEKLHGTNCRVGLIDGEYMVGSRNLRRDIPSRPAKLGFWSRLFHSIFRRPTPTEWDAQKMREDWYSYPLTLDPVLDMLEELHLVHNSVVLYGEVFGKNVQGGMDYGTPDQVEFAAFDIVLDGEHLDYDDFQHLCSEYGVLAAPLVYRGPFSMDDVKKAASGASVMTDSHMREGVVVRPIRERRSPRVGRVVFKYVSDDFLAAKDSGDFADFAEE